VNEREPAAERRTATATAAHIARRLEAAAQDGFEPESVILRGDGGLDELEVEVVLVRHPATEAPPSDGASDPRPSTPPRPTPHGPG